MTLGVRLRLLDSKPGLKLPLVDRNEHEAIVIDAKVAVDEAPWWPAEAFRGH